MREDIAVENLKQVKDVLDRYNVEFWLDIGTLLGAVRGGKFIPYDHDIDFGTWEKNVAMVVSACRKLQGMGFTIRLNRYFISIEKKEIAINISLYHLNNSEAIKGWGGGDRINYLFNIFLNILFWGMLAPYYGEINFKTAFSLKSLIKITLGKISRITPNLLRKWAVKIEKKWRNKIWWVVPSDYFKNLSTMNFYGMEFKIPAKTEEYLTYRYGKDWRIPRTDWITIRDDGAIE